MKKFMSLLTIALLCGLILTACAEKGEQATGSSSGENQATQEEPAAQNISYNPGTYEGEGRGFEGAITTEVTLSEANIENIKVLNHNDTPEIGGKAMEDIIKNIIDKQRLDVDSVSGATYSSDGIITAVTTALQAAEADVEAIGGTYVEIKPDLPPCQRLTDVTPADAEEGITVYHFETDGSTCTTGFKVTLDGTKFVDVVFEGDPCVGNSKGIVSLVGGMEMKDVIEKFDGILCPGAGDISSCPDQLAVGLKQIDKVMNGIACEGCSESSVESPEPVCEGDCEDCPLKEE